MKMAELLPLQVSPFTIMDYSIFEFGSAHVLYQGIYKIMANIVEPDQTAPKEQSDLGLLCLP